MAMHYGRPSYTIGNDSVEVFSTVQGGHTSALFEANGRKIFPYFVAPWWKEATVEELAPTVQIMRGDYFCFPFGSNNLPYEGLTQPLHGRTANECWDLAGLEQAGKEKTLSLKMNLLPEDGEVIKTIRIVSGEPVLYINHIVRDFEGKSSVGTHPCIQCPEKTGAAYFDMTNPVAGFSPPVPGAVPENRGYYLLKPGVSIHDRERVPTIYGDTVDLTRYPLPRGYEDVAMFISDHSKEFTFASVAIPEWEYLYFQLKNPRVLAGTLCWMPNGGSYYPPLNGRMFAVIGLDEITGYFFYGRKQSVEANPLQDKGYKTFLDFNAVNPTEIKMIQGVIPVRKSFKGVKDILRKNASEVTILGKGGEKIDVPCSVDFLKDA